MLGLEGALEVSSATFVDTPAEVAAADDACVSGHLRRWCILELSDVIPQLIEKALESLQALLQLVYFLSLALNQLTILVSRFLDQPLELGICHFLSLLHLLLELFQLLGDLLVHGVYLRYQVLHRGLVLVQVLNVVI